MLFHTSGQDDFLEPEHAPLAVSGRVLIVDDDRSIRMLYRSSLARQFDVITASSGEEALSVAQASLPDLIVLDITMPGIDGYETCHRLRQFTDIPILFVTASTTLEEKLRAFDSGGTDIISKPVDVDLLLRKVQLEIHRHQQALTLTQEKQDLQKMAMGFLSSASQNGVLLGFVRDCIACIDHDVLMNRLMATTRELGVKCSAILRLQAREMIATSEGVPTALEVSILRNAPSMGRQFQFKNRLVINYARISIIASNMPDEREDSARAGMLRDTLTSLAEATESLVINVEVRQESERRATQMRQIMADADALLSSLKRQHGVMQADIRILLQELVDKVEATYAQLDTTQAQEQALNETMLGSIHMIQARLTNNQHLDRLFAQLMLKLDQPKEQGPLPSCP
jgi:CheY-like chemotaxis protein